MDPVSREWARKVRMVPTRAASPLRSVFLSDKNLSVLVRAFRRFGREVLAMTDEEIARLSLGDNDPMTQAIWGTAQSEAARTLTLTDAHLRKLNQEAFKIGHRNLSIDISTYRRWDEFLEFGVNEAMAPRPSIDVYRAEMKLAKRPIFGHGATRFNPFESMYEGGAVDDFEQMWGLVSTRRAEIAGTDDYKIKVLP